MDERRNFIARLLNWGWRCCAASSAFPASPATSQTGYAMLDWLRSDLGGDIAARSQLTASFISNQACDVACWPFADMVGCLRFGRYWGQSRRGELLAENGVPDPTPSLNHRTRAPLNAERRGFGKRQSTAPAARLVSTSSIRTTCPVLGNGGDVELDTPRAVLSIP